MGISCVAMTGSSSPLAHATTARPRDIATTPPAALNSVGAPGRKAAARAQAKTRSDAARGGGGCPAAEVRACRARGKRVPHTA